MQKCNKILSLLLAFSLCLGMIGILPVQVTADETNETDETDEMIPIYQDTSYSFEERAADLVSRMTFAEKASQMNTSAPAIPRLGIKENNWWQEALHGVAWARGVSFPSSLSMSLTWDPDLLLETASIIGDECRAYNTSSGRALSNFCPTVNIQRDPRWGRNEEGYGEDPFLVTALGEQYINGMQGNLDTENVTSPSGEKYLKTISTLKHYAANNSEQDRYTGSADVDERTLLEYYTSAFRDITKRTRPESVMSSYNRVNGTPASANTYILDTLLRKTWGFSGYVVSDCEGISWIRNGHEWVPSNPSGEYTERVTMPQAAAFSLMAGTDLACNWTSGGNFGGDYSNNLAKAIDDEILTDNGVMSEDAADLALVRLFTARMKTGEFDPKTFEYSQYTVNSHVETAANVASSLKASQKAIVMLKNDDKTLPIDINETKSIAVIGKFNDVCELGDTNYAGSPTTKVSFKSGLTSALNAKGFDTANNLKFYSASSGTVSGYIFNINQFSINGTTIPAISANTFDNCRAETSNIGYINDGGYAIYENIDLGAELTSFTASVSTDGTSGSVKPVVELRMDGPTGKLIAKAICDRTGSWSTYVSNTGTIEDGLFHEDGLKNICLRFTTDQSDSTGGLDLEAIGEADMAIYMAGTGKSSELNVAGENKDRNSMNFPANQAGEIKQVVEANPNTVVAIQAVGMMNIGDFVDDVKAVLFTSLNGQFQGQAMAEVLLGDQNADGRLSFTWYADESELRDILDYEIRPTDTEYGRTYQYFTGNVLYPFGYGMSYTSFAYTDLQIDNKDLDANGEFKVSAKVTNTGDVKGDEVAQLYITTPDAPAALERPMKRLKGFEKVSLEPGETKTVTMTVKVPDLSFYDEDLGKYVVDNGRYGVQVGNSSADEDIQLEDEIQVTGTLKSVISEVTLRMSQEGDEEKDIPNRVLFGYGRTVVPKITVAMNDETLYGSIKKDDYRTMPEGMTYKYTSNRPEVVSVDANGVIQTGKSGVATITATVTYDGESETAKAVVYVQSDIELTEINVDGKPLSGFSSGTYNYNMTVPAGTPPEVTAIANSEKAEVVVTQATGVPGKATVTISGEGIDTLTYTINFSVDLSLKDLKVDGTPVIGFSPTKETYNVRVLEGPLPKVTAEANDTNAIVDITQAQGIPGVAKITVTIGDSTATYSINLRYAPPRISFMDGEIDSGWEILNPDPEGYSVEPGMGLRLPTQDSDIYEATTGWKNIFVRPVEGDWEVVSAVYYPQVPFADYQQNALLVWQDEDDYIKLGYEYNGDRLLVQIGQEVEGSFASIGSVPYTAPAGDPLNIYYRIQKEGNSYTGSYSLDGTNYTTVGTTTLDLQDIQIGFYATKNSANDPLDTYVQYIEVDEVKASTPTPAVVLTADSRVNPGATFIVGIGLDNLDQGIHAEDITLSYDSDKFEYVSAVGLDDDIIIMEEDKSTDGVIRLIAANTSGVVGDSTKVINVTFKVKGGVHSTTGTIAITKAELGIGSDGTVIEADLDSKVITIGDTQTVIDRTALTAAIDNAQSLYDAAVVGTQPGEYPQAAKDALNTAIDEAEAVKDDSNATQSKIDDAVTALNRAVTRFKAAVIGDVSPDLNNNGIIDVGDLAYVAYYYGRSSSDEDWEAAKIADMNGDNKINIVDLVFVASRIPE